MNKKLISVVVPVYNVEKYLDCCLESIVNQTYKNLEIILVDDGSTDACPRMCDEWADKDARIRVIHKENQGAGMARNTGIEHANGEYICFFDSDDYVLPYTIEKAYVAAQEHDTDIVLYGYVEINQSGEIIEKHVPNMEKQMFIGEEIQNTFLPDLIDCSFKGSRNQGVPFSLWVCMFSMRLMHLSKWRFMSEREVYSEDSCALIQLYKDVNRICILNETLYYHRQNNASLSRAVKKDRFIQIKAFASKALELAEQCGYNDKVRERICSVVFNFTIDAMKQIALSDESFGIKIKYLREIISDSLFRICLKKCRYGKENFAKSILQKAIIFKTATLVYALVYIKAAKQNKFMK